MKWQRSLGISPAVNTITSTLPPTETPPAKQPLKTLKTLPPTKAPTERPPATPKKSRGPRHITASGKNVCLLCRSARCHRKRCPTLMERVRSNYIMDVPERPVVPTASPTTTGATNTNDDDVYSSVCTESETRLFHHFLPRCPTDDFGAMTTQWNTLLRAWRLSDCLDVQVTTGRITLANVTFKTPKHLAAYAQSVAPAPVPTSKPRRRRRQDDSTSPDAASKRQYLPCPHCGHQTRRHVGDIGDKCELFVYYAPELWRHLVYV